MTNQFHFVFIDEFRKLKNIGFNFSNDYRIHFDYETQTLFLDKHHVATISDYFGDRIISINAIIGYNRAGKTSFIEFMSSYLVNYHAKSIFIIGSKVYYNQRRWESGLKLTGSAAHEFEQIPFFSEGDYGNVALAALKQFNFIAFSNSYYQNPWWGSGYTHDITTAQLLETDLADWTKRTQKLNIKQVIANKTSDLKRNVEFLNWAESSNFPQLFGSSLEMVGLYFNSDHIFNQYADNTNLIQLQKWCYSRVQGYTQELSPTDRFQVIKNLDLVKEWLGCSIINYLMTTADSIDDLKNFDYIKKDFVYDFTNILDRINYNTETISKEVIVHLFSIIANLQSSDVIGEYKPFMGVFNDFHSFFGGLFQCRLRRNIIDSFLELRLQMQVDLPLYEFTWGLSAGEHAFLNFLSRIKYANDKLVTKNSKSGPILLLLDEPTMHFHPEWERKFINYLVDLIPRLLDNPKLQIIFTTHSPLTISDLPANNVLILKQGELAGTTNASNIPTLGNDPVTIYYEDFGIGDPIMGDYTRLKMEDYFAPIIEKRVPSDDEKNRMISFANMIGDEIIRNKLLELSNAKPKTNDTLQ